MNRLILSFTFLIVLFKAHSNDIKVEDYLENIHTSINVDDATIKWNIKYEKLPFSNKLIIRYLPENLTKLDLNPQWKYSKLIDPKETNFELYGLITGEKYAFSIGILPDSVNQFNKSDVEGISWSKTKTFKTERGWSMSTGLIMKILILLGSLGLFIYGMKIMSEGIQKAAGEKLRQILGAMTNNRIKGIFTGFLTTSIIQSSSATTVMVVSFVNAGLLNLKQSIGVIMGANIGTTVTAWLVAFLGFSISMSDYALPIFLFAIVMMFSSRGTIKSWGEMLAGFAILFIGLEMLKSGVPDVKGSAEQLTFLKDLTGHGVFSVILFVLIGTVVTVVVQSSSAAMAVTILLCERGVIPFDMAAGMVLGENIGTTITANLAAIVGNVHAKRAARSHFIFNVFGVIWLVAVFPWYMDLIDYLTSLSYPSPRIDQNSRPIALALFHTIFNIANVLILVWFTPQIAKMVVKMVPSKGAKDDEFHLEYITAGVLATPELFLLEAKKEVAKFGKITSRMSGFFQKLMVEQDKKKKQELFERIQKYEEITDRVEIEVSRYLSECAENDLSQDSTMQVRAMLAITNDLERIGDIFYQMSLSYKRKEEERIWFSPDQRKNIKSMTKLLDEAFVIMVDNLNMDQEKVTIDKAFNKEIEINAMRDKLRMDHLASIEDSDFNIKSGIIYTDLLYSCEKVGDHIINVTEALIGQNIIGEK